jgi:hypothetical protein
MKHRLTSVAIAAVFAIAAPGWAQQANAFGGKPVGMPSSMLHASSATPPLCGSTRGSHAKHDKMARRHGGGSESAGDIANQLNQQELARAQAGVSNSGSTVPSAAARPGPGPAPSSRMAGPKTAGSGYIPPQPGAGSIPPEASPRTVGPSQGGAR